MDTTQKNFLVMERLSNGECALVLRDLKKRDPHSITSPSQKTNVMTVKHDCDLLQLDNSVFSILDVKDGVCNSPSVDRWDFFDYTLLKELIVGNNCFQYVMGFQFTGLNQLEKVEVGKNCFCMANRGVFEIKECRKLISVKIGDGSFVNVKKVVFKDLPALKSITLGEEVFSCEGELVMENLNQLTSLTAGSNTLKRMKTVTLTELPRLRECQLANAFQDVGFLTMRNAGVMAENESLKKAESQTQAGIALITILGLLFCGWLFFRVIKGFLGLIF